MISDFRSDVVKKQGRKRLVASRERPHNWTNLIPKCTLKMKTLLPAVAKAESLFLMLM
jgi:hypothetical protein